MPNLSPSRNKSTRPPLLPILRAHLRKTRMRVVSKRVVNSIKFLTLLTVKINKRKKALKSRELSKRTSRTKPETQR